MTDTPEEKPEVVVTPNPHSTKSTADKVRENIQAEADAFKIKAAKEAEAEAAATAAKAAELKGDLPKEEEKPEDKPEEKPEEKSEVPLDTEKFGDTGSEVGNSVLTLLQNAGAEPDDAKALLFEAVQANDMSKIDKAALVALVGEAQATIILTGTATYANEIAAKNAAISTAVNDAVGSADNWAIIQKWVDTSDITDTDKAEYNALITEGGAKARFAATELLAKYNADKNNTQITDDPRVNADVDTTTQSKATTAKEYYAQMVVAQRRGLDTTAIKAARARGRKEGI